MTQPFSTCAIGLTVRSHASPPTVIGNADLWSACAQRRFGFDAERRPPVDVGDPSLRSDGKRRAAHALQSAVAQPEATNLPAAGLIAQVGSSSGRGSSRLGGVAMPVGVGPPPGKAVSSDPSPEQRGALQGLSPSSGHVPPRPDRPRLHPRPGRRQVAADTFRGQQEERGPARQTQDAWGRWAVRACAKQALSGALRSRPDTAANVGRSGALPNALGGEQPAFAGTATSGTDSTAFRIAQKELGRA